MEDGQQFTIFRHAKIHPAGEPAAKFIARFTPAHTSVHENIHFSLLPTIPLLGMHGFREKYWCVNEQTGQCQGLYARQTIADANGYRRSVAPRFMTARSATSHMNASRRSRINLRRDSKSQRRRFDPCPTHSTPRRSAKVA